jgi:ADP-ribose pyrophosphatase
MSETRREIYKGRVLHLFAYTVTLPNGHTTTLEIIHHPGASAVVPFVTDDEILLVRQYRHAAGGYLIEIPAGKLDHGESPETCAVRETEEETGHRPGRLEKLGAIFTTPGFTDEVIHLYAAYDLTPSRIGHEQDEVMTVLRMPFADAIARVESGEITDAKTVGALLLAARRNAKPR